MTSNGVITRDHRTGPVSAGQMQITCWTRWSVDSVGSNNAFFSHMTREYPHEILRLRTALGCRKEQLNMKSIPGWLAERDGKSIILLYSKCGPGKRRSLITHDDE